MSGHKSQFQNMDYLCPIVDPAKNKIWNIYVRTQVKIAKDGFDLCPNTSQNRKIWQLCLMDKFVLYGIMKAYS